MRQRVFQRRRVCCGPAALEAEVKGGGRWCKRQLRRGYRYNGKNNEQRQGHDDLNNRSYISTCMGDVRNTDIHRRSTARKRTKERNGEREKKRSRDTETNYETDQKAGSVIKSPLGAPLFPAIMKSISYRAGGGACVRPLSGVSVQYAKVHTLPTARRPRNQPLPPPDNPPFYGTHFRHEPIQTHTHARTKQTPARSCLQIS